MVLDSLDGFRKYDKYVYMFINACYSKLMQIDVWKNHGPVACSQLKMWQNRAKTHVFSLCDFFNWVSSRAPLRRQTLNPRSRQARTQGSLSWVICPRSATVCSHGWTQLPKPSPWPLQGLAPQAWAETAAEADHANPQHWSQDDTTNHWETCQFHTSSNRI